MEKRKVKQIIEKNSWLISFFLSALAMFLMLFFSGMTGNGKYVVLRGDLLEQYVSDIRMFARSLAAGETPFYQFCVSMGFSAVLPIALEVLNPFNLLYFIFYNADVNIITVVVLILKTGLISASFHLFIRKIHNTEFLPALLISVFYAMCGFAVVYGSISFFWLDALYIFPLCALAVNKALFENKYIYLVPVFAYALITQFYMGYLTGIFGFVYFMLLLFLKMEEKNGTQKAKEFGKFILYSLAAVLIAGIVWLPVLHFLMNHNASDRTAFAGLQVGLLEVFNNLFWGEFQNYKWAPYLYCGIPCLLVFPFYFLNKKIERKEKIVYGALIIFFASGFVVDFMYRLFHGFDAPDSFHYRFSFIISFLICVISCRQISLMKEIKKGYYIAWIIGIIAFFLLETRFQRMEIGGLSANGGIVLLVNMLLISIWPAMYFLYENREKARKILAGVMIVLALSETIANGVVCMFSNGVMENNGVTKTEFDEWEREYKIALDTIEKKEAGNSDFYRVNFNDDLIHNSDSFWGYNGVSDFCTAENETLRNTMGSLGFYTSQRVTYATGMTPVTAMLLSVKYNGRLYSGYANEGTAKDAEIETAEYVLPIGYMAGREILEELPFGENVFENQNYVIQSLCGVEGVFEPVGKERIKKIENGLTILEDNTVISGYGELAFGVTDASGPLYIQLSQESQKVTGIYFDTYENMASPIDTMASFPVAAKMNTNEDGAQYISLWSDAEFSGTLNITGVNIYELNEEKLKEAYALLSKEVLKISGYKNGYIKGTITINDSNRVLMTSIPVTDGWTVKVNGAEAVPLEAVNAAFFAVELPGEGEYTIEFLYKCPGMKEGIIVSGIGLLIACMLIVYQVSKDKKKEDVNS